MSDLSYSFIKLVGSHVVWVTSRPLILHRERADRTGPYILASNHLSPYDAAGLIYGTPRRIDFLSIVEVLKNPLAGAFLRSMNCTFADRSKADRAAAQSLASRLRAGRAVAMFPEGGIRTEQNSVMNGAGFRPGCLRLSQLTGAPIIPAIIIGTQAYSDLKMKAWLPGRAIRWGLIYGQPIEVITGDEGRAEGEKKLRQAFIDLTQELRAAMTKPK